MEIKKLLFVTKFDELRFDALQSLLDLRNAALDHIVFLNKDLWPIGKIYCLIPGQRGD